MTFQAQDILGTYKTYHVNPKETQNAHKERKEPWRRFETVQMKRVASFKYVIMAQTPTPMVQLQP
jgi:hypothetical protein